MDNQADFVNWEFVKKQIDKNTMPREDWRKILGKSLTKIIVHHKGMNETATECYLSILKTYPDLTSNQKRLIKISCDSRYSENNSINREISKTVSANFQK